YQAEDGIRDRTVTGVQTCALPILVVGAAVLLVTLPFVEIEFRHPLWIAAFAFCGSAVLGSLGMIAGIWSEKIDQVAAFQNFFIKIGRASCRERVRHQGVTVFVFAR